MLRTQMRRKYYDDCAQVLTEHILAAKRPTCLKGFSTLDPLVKHVYHEEIKSFFRPLRPSSTLSRVARLLQGDNAAEASGNTETTSEFGGSMASGEQCPSPSRSDTSTGGVLATVPEPSAATTLVDGAIPVRDMPDILASQPASLCASSTTSQEDDTNGNGTNTNNNKHTLRRLNSSGTLSDDRHQEELR